MSVCWPQLLEPPTSPPGFESLAGQAPRCPGTCHSFHWLWLCFNTLFPRYKQSSNTDNSNNLEYIIHTEDLLQGHGPRGSVSTLGRQCGLGPSYSDYDPYSTDKGSDTGLLVISSGPRLLLFQSQNVLGGHEVQTHAQGVAHNGPGAFWLILEPHWALTTSLLLPLVSGSQNSLACLGDHR